MNEVAIEVTITLHDAQRSVPAGFTQAADFYKRLAINPAERQLYLEREEVVIPLLPDEYIIIRGGEKMSVGEIDPNIEENPDIKQAVCPELNGKKLESGFTKAKIVASELQERDDKVQPNKLFIDMQGQADVFVPEGATIFVQEVDSYFIIPLGDDEAIDLELCARFDRKPPKGQKHYKIKIDGIKYKVDRQEMTGKEILSLTGKKYDQWTMNQKFRGGRRKPIEADDKVDLAQPGIERLETVPRQAQQG